MNKNDYAEYDKRVKRKNPQTKLSIDHKMHVLWSTIVERTPRWR